MRSVFKIILKLLSIVAVCGGVKYKFDSHPCVRECSKEPKNGMTCGYNFTLENYWTLFPLACGSCATNSTDCARTGCLPTNGIRRGVTVVNRMLPGPAIRVCEGDRIFVDVQNLLLGGQDTGIHWHGISQTNTPWFDGVPGVTQCPISTQAHFRYEFEAESAGTSYWHAHSNFQRVDGLFGSLVIRKAKEDEGNGGRYDFDLPQHEILLWDWLEESSIARLLNQYGGNGIRSNGILVNGKGFPSRFWENHENATLQNSSKSYATLHELRVQQGKSYRWRIISNGVLNCPIEMSIDGHTMLVIASDGSDVTPTLISSLVVHSSERWDVVLQAKQVIGSYWIKFRGLHDCNSSFSQEFQLAVLNYEPILTGTIPTREIRTWEEAAAIQVTGPHLNSLDVTSGGVQGPFISLGELTSPEDDVELLQGTPDSQFYISANFKDVEELKLESSGFPLSVVQKGGKFYVPQLNQISNVMPPTPLLTFTGNKTQSLDFCNETYPLGESRNCATELCLCTHVLQVKLNSTVEMILVDSGAPFAHSHIFHLHGHGFRVVAMQSLPKPPLLDVKRMDEQGLIHRRTKKAPIRDTIPVPDGGFTIIRFRAENPGFWALETQSLLTAGLGMNLILQVGSRDDMKNPPSNFPSCGNFRPETSNGTRIEWDLGRKIIEEEITTTTSTTSTAEGIEEDDSNPSNGTTKSPTKPPGKKNGAGSSFNWANKEWMLLFLMANLFSQWI